MSGIEWIQRIGYGLHEPMDIVKFDIPDEAAEAFEEWYEPLKGEEWFSGSTATIAILSWMAGWNAAAERTDPGR